MAKDLRVKALVGDAKTLLAFDLPKAKTKNLAGFTILCAPKGQPPYYLLNTLRFEKPGDHAQDDKESSAASINSPFQKFRWLHVLGSAHQGIQPFFGSYTYTTTPRYFDDKGSLLPMDPSQSVSVPAEVQPFEKKGLKLGFTRGYVQSQAFGNHFGAKALIQPSKSKLGFDTTVQAGKNAEGQSFSYTEEYAWLGFT